MLLPSFLEKLFGRTEASKDTAKNRLRLVLMHDRAAIPAGVLEQMRSELLMVLSKYVEIDQEALEVNLERSEGTVALLANVPILRVRTDLEINAAATGAAPPSPVVEQEPAEPALAST